jgi:hypothetical protein
MFSDLCLKKNYAVEIDAMFVPCVNSLHKEGQLWELVSTQGRGMATICSMDTVSKQIPIEWYYHILLYLQFVELKVAIPVGAYGNS